MRITLIGPVIVGLAVLFFGYLLFKGMVLEWHRRDRESGGAA